MGRSSGRTPAPAAPADRRGWFCAPASLLCNLNKPLDSWLAWEPCGDERAAGALAHLAGETPEVFSATRLINARSATLPFYASHRLLELEFVRNGRRLSAFALDRSDVVRWLDGETRPIYETNLAESLVLSDAPVLEYVRFFCAFVRDDSGAFDSPAEVVSLTIRTTDEHGRWVIDALVDNGGALFRNALAVAADGEVEMLANGVVLEGLSVSDHVSRQLAAADPHTRRTGVRTTRWFTRGVAPADIADDDGGRMQVLLRRLTQREPGTRECHIARQADGTWRCIVCGTPALTPSPQMTPCPRWIPTTADR